MYEQMKKSKENKSRVMAKSANQKEIHSLPVPRITKKTGNVVTSIESKSMRLNTARTVGKTYQINSSILQLKTANGTQMRGRVMPTNAQRGRVTNLLARCTEVARFITTVGTIYFESDVRIDMQGVTTNGYYNIQVQIGDETAATVLIDPFVTDITEVKQAFLDSMEDGYTKIVTPDEMPEESNVTGGYYDNDEHLSRNEKELINRAKADGSYPPRKKK